jgi:hypothetical protein
MCALRPFYQSSSQHGHDGHAIAVLYVEVFLLSAGSQRCKMSKYFASLHFDIQRSTSCGNLQGTHDDVGEDDAGAEPEEGPSDLITELGGHLKKVDEHLQGLRSIHDNLKVLHSLTPF